jgi:hypothetical protein
MPERHAFASIPTKILLPIDFSPSSQTALEPVYDLEARYGEGANKAIIGQSPVR